MVGAESSARGRDHKVVWPLCHLHELPVPCVFGGGCKCFRLRLRMRVIMSQSYLSMYAVQCVLSYYLLSTLSIYCRILLHHTHWLGSYTLCRLWADGGFGLMPMYLLVRIRLVSLSVSPRVAAWHANTFKNFYGGKAVSWQNRCNN